MHRAAVECDDQLQAQWMYDFLSTYMAEQMVVLDKSSKNHKTFIHKYGQSTSEDDAVLQVSLDRGVQYCILPALTIEGIFVYMLLKVQ